MRAIQTRELKAPLIPELDPVVARIMSARGVERLDQLDASLKGLIPPDQLKDIDKAADVIYQHIKGRGKIVIVGDHDADGCCSTVVLMKALGLMGAHVDFVVTNRFTDGYGLSPKLCDKIAPYEPDCLITVDNGISAIAGVKEARARGWDVVVTDHHLAGAELPDANAIVNPNQPDCHFPSKAACGALVAWYVAYAVKQLLEQKAWFTETGIAVPNMASLLDVVGLATVADMVKLDENNRRVVANALGRIKAGKACTGIYALIDVAKRNFKSITSMDFGFALGPRINAAGRLEDMRAGVELLLSSDPEEARIIAEELDTLNRERRQIETKSRQEAEANLSKQLEQMDVDAQALPAAIVLNLPGTNEGVIGLVSSRIKEKNWRPTIVFTDTEENNTLKGSARSIDGVHCRDLLDAVDKKHPGIIQKFGGHAGAAGLSINADRFSDFQEAVVEEMNELIVSEPELFEPVYFSDGELAAEQINLGMAEQLNRYIWGQGFPEPLFSNEFEVVSVKRMGSEQQHLKLMVQTAPALYADIVAFNEPELQIQAGDRIKTCYKLNINEFAPYGRPPQITLQLLSEQIEVL